MNIKWCAFTGALMLFFVGATWIDRTVTQDPPGVSTRWWNGTRAFADTYYQDGKLYTHTEYGEDGQTVLRFAKFNRKGVIVRQKMRLEDGTLEEKTFTSDGATLLGYTLWNGDERSFRIQRQYSEEPDTLGKIVSETIKTLDGRTTMEERTYSPPGVLSVESKILDNGWADQQTDNYQDGKLIARSILRGNGDNIVIIFSGNGAMATRSTRSFFNGNSIKEYFDDDGQPLVSRETPGDNPRAPIVSVYEGGKLKYKQTLNAFRVATVEEYSTITGKLERKVALDVSLKVISIKHFREDGTLALLKYLNNGVVVREVQFDDTGHNVISDKAGGEPESVDSDRLTPGDERPLKRGGRR